MWKEQLEELVICLLGQLEKLLLHIFWVPHLDTANLGISKEAQSQISNHGPISCPCAMEYWDKDSFSFAQNSFFPWSSAGFEFRLVDESNSAVCFYWDRLPIYPLQSNILRCSRNLQILSIFQTIFGKLNRICHQIYTN